MNIFSEQQSKTIEHVIDSLITQIPQFANVLISDVPENRHFRMNPDSPKEHKTAYHQWGIITHMVKFEEALRCEVPDYLKHWHLESKIEPVLRESIDGISKAQLLRLVSLLHDIGKFSSRTVREDRFGKIKINFINHEKASGVIIRSSLVSTELAQSGLTSRHIEYIARLSELHFELGIVRNRAKVSELGYSLEFIQSDYFKEIGEAISNSFPDHKIEIGLLFLADSLAKVELRPTLFEDGTWDTSDAAIKDFLRTHQLDPALIATVRQLPINIEASRVYLVQTLKNRQSSD